MEPSPPLSPSWPVWEVTRLGEASPGRPRVLVRRHVLEIKEETQEWIEELADKYLVGKSIGALGESLQGLLGNPVAFPVLAGAVLTALGVAVGKEGVESIVKWFEAIQGIYAATSDDERRKEADNLIESMRAVIDFFTPPAFPIP